MRTNTQDLVVVRNDKNMKELMFLEETRTNFTILACWAKEGSSRKVA